MLHIHAPQPDSECISSGYCPDCQRHSWFIGFHTLWYGWDSTCLRCGRRWMDGEWKPLDFVRGSRQKSVAAAKKRWRKFKKQSQK